VAFVQPRLVIDRLGATVAAPVAVGSTVSPLTIASDSPGVVEITPDGHLHALRDGHAEIRSIGHPTQRLQVDVRSVAGLAVWPDVVPLESGDEVQLDLREPGARGRLDATQAEWATSAPDVALVIAGRVEAKGKEGSAVVTARYGGRVASARVVVAERRGRTLAIRPQAPSLRVGEIVTFEAPDATGAPRWSAGATSILTQSGSATFVAAAAGKTTVCAEVGARRSSKWHPVGDLGNNPWASRCTRRHRRRFRLHGFSLECRSELRIRRRHHRLLIDASAPTEATADRPETSGPQVLQHWRASAGG
jgi:hypothetical protein